MGAPAVIKPEHMHEDRHRLAAGVPTGEIFTFPLADSSRRPTRRSRHAWSVARPAGVEHRVRWRRRNLAMVKATPPSTRHT